MHSIRLSLIGCAVVFCQCAGPGHRSRPSDLDSYLDRIQTQKMSEGGREAIIQVAGIRLGQTVLSFQKDDQSGMYFPTYSSTSCPRPGANLDSLQKRQAEFERLLDSEVNNLRLLADRDSSGFVSTEEGVEFRSLAEFGLRFSSVVRQEHGDTTGICKGLGVNWGAVRDRLDTYNRLARRARASGIEGLTELSLNGSE